MSGNVTESHPFAWSVRSEAAAGAVADDQQTDDEIAAAAGITPRTLARWKKHAEFRARVDKLVAEAREAARQQTIVNKRVRVDRLADRASRIDRVFAARAGLHADVPGGDTGLLVREPKIVKVYDVQNWRDEDDEDDERLMPTGGVRVVYEYKVDTGTLTELRQIEKQAAQEVGEWVEKVAPTKGDGSDLTLADLLVLTQVGAT